MIFLIWVLWVMLEMKDVSSWRDTHSERECKYGIRLNTTHSTYEYTSSSSKKSENPFTCVDRRKYCITNSKQINREHQPRLLTTKLTWLQGKSSRDDRGAILIRVRCRSERVARQNSHRNSNFFQRTIEFVNVPYRNGRHTVQSNASQNSLAFCVNLR